MKHSNLEINEYFNILCSNDYPKFIDKYLKVPELERLKGIGQFCGADYTKLYNVKYWYTRYDHSIACALMTWHFTKDQKQTITALLHDLGTPTFSHCIDYLLNDHINQESAERSIGEVILSSKKLLNCLKQDHINVNEITDPSIYTVLENKKPKLCVDRLEGILHTGLIWEQYWLIKDIKLIYQDIIVLTNETDELEIGFNNKDIADKFFYGVYLYSIALQKSNDKYAMQFIADWLKQAIDRKIISLDDLYQFSETELIDLINNDYELKDLWIQFNNFSKVIESDEKPNNCYYVSIDCKKRYVVPLCLDNNYPVRLNVISNYCDKLLAEYLAYESKKYTYIEGINF